LSFYKLVYKLYTQVNFSSHSILLQGHTEKPIQAHSLSININVVYDELNFHPNTVRDVGVKPIWSRTP